MTMPLRQDRMDPPIALHERAMDDLRFNAWMAAGFGGLHIGFGLLIARRHGG